MSQDYVSKDFCNERFQRLIEMLETIDIKLDKLIAEKVQAALNGKLSRKESFSAWRSLLFAICGGAIVAGLNYIFQHL